MRIKLQFEDFIGVSSKRKVCFFVDKESCRTVNDLCYLISKQYYTGKAASDVLLYLDGYFVPPQEAIRIIKDDDILTVKYKHIIFFKSPAKLQ